jgi:hypothetical protein
LLVALPSIEKSIVDACQNIAPERAEERADFKGWFRTRDDRRIDPLTITDPATVTLLRMPRGLPAGWPDTPLRKRPPCIRPVLSGDASVIAVLSRGPSR